MGELFCCDNQELLRRQPTESVDLIYLDPPFNTGRPQSNHRARQGYEDRWQEGIEGYLNFLRPRLLEMHRILKKTGTLYVHLDWHAVHYVKVWMDGLFGYGNFLNEIIWFYSSGGTSKRWFARKHDNILVYAKQKGLHTFHVQRGGTFRTDGIRYDAEGRPYKSTRRGQLYFNKNGPVISDVWDIPFLSTVSLERTGYPTQKPKALLERIIAASSNADDLVADFFCGSGTTLVVAQEMGREYLGCDINPQATQIAQSRLMFPAKK